MPSLTTIVGFGSALLFAGVLYHQSSKPVPVKDTGDVFVFYSSKCEKPGDASHCTKMVLPIGSLTSFKTMDACMAHVNVMLGMYADPTIMGSCERMQES